MIKVGDTVKLTQAQSIDHFRAAGMTTIGTVIDFKPGNMQGNHLREYGVQFPDRPGVWYYAGYEIYVQRRQYLLSDGHEVDRYAWMTQSEYEQAQAEAEEQTGGNWGWYPVE